MYILNNIITNECVDFFRNKIEKDLQVLKHKFKI